MINPLTIEEAIYNRLNLYIRDCAIPKSYGIFHRGRLLSITTRTGKFFSRTGTAKAVFNRKFRGLENKFGTVVPTVRAQKEEILKRMWDSKELEIKEVA